LAKTKVRRGTRRRFDVYITDQDGNAQNPDSCVVRLVKQGTRQDDSPIGPVTCALVGTTGHWGASIFLSDTMTLGEWVAKFTWFVSGNQDGEDFEFVIEDLAFPDRDTPIKVIP
jgi:hypothetical protein